VDADKKAKFSSGTQGHPGVKVIKLFTAVIYEFS
jgi:hypothetical protein